MRNGLITTSIAIAFIGLSSTGMAITQADVTAAQAAVTAAQTAVNTAQTAVTAKQTAVTTAQTNLTNAQAALTKQKNSTIAGTLAYMLAKKQITSAVYSTKLATYTNAVTTANNALTAAKSALTSAQTTLTTAQATLATKTTAYNTILAQFNAQATATPTTTTPTTTTPAATTPATTTTPTTTTPATTTTTAATTTYTPATFSATPGSTLPLLIAGQSYTVGQLLRYIRTNNPQANFYVRSGTDQRSASSDPTLQSLLNNNINLSVTLQQDTALITWLASNGQLTNDVKAKYQQIMLCFNISGTTFYIVKPYPGVTKTTTSRQAGKVVKTTRNPAAEIIKNFNFSRTVTPAALE